MALEKTNGKIVDFITTKGAKSEKYKPYIRTFIRTFLYILDINKHNNFLFNKFIIKFQSQ